jgi:hypothetical protein
VIKWWTEAGEHPGRSALVCGHVRGALQCGAVYRSNSNSTALFWTVEVASLLFSSLVEAQQTHITTIRCKLD